MIETTKTVTVSETVLNDDEDFIDLLLWSKGQDGVYVSVTGTVDGELVAEVGGTSAASVRLERGDTLRWDGAVFEVEKAPVEPEPEFHPFADATPQDHTSSWEEVG